MATEKERQKVWADAVNHMLIGRYSTNTSCSLHGVGVGAIQVANMVLEEFDKQFPASKK